MEKVKARDTQFTTSLPESETGMAGTKSSSACLEDDVCSGSASPGYPAPSTGTTYFLLLGHLVFATLRRTTQ